MPKYAMKGIPDIIAIKIGKFIGIEMKTETGKLSKEQADFARECVRHGGEYIVARSIDDVVRAGLNRLTRAPELHSAFRTPRPDDHKGCSGTRERRTAHL